MHPSWIRLCQCFFFLLLLTEDASAALVVSSSSEITVVVVVVSGTFRRVFGVVVVWVVKPSRLNVERCSRMSVSLSLADESSSVLETSNACGDVSDDRVGPTTAMGAAVFCGVCVDVMMLLLDAIRTAVRHDGRIAGDVDEIDIVGFVKAFSVVYFDGCARMVNW